MHRVGLIAGREIAAYAALPSFWIALIIGPALMLIVGLFAGPAPDEPAPPPHAVAVVADRDTDRLIATVALDDAGRISGHPIAVVAPSASPSTRIDVNRSLAGQASARISGEPLPPAALALLERDLALPAAMPRANVVVIPPKADKAGGDPKVDPSAIGRFALTALLWLNLTGSLGMLLQAVVRERANRALEILLASTRPWEIVAGKLIGVGALSILVLAIWLASGAIVAQSSLAGAEQGVGQLVLAGFTRPADLALAAVVFTLAFAMYGAAMIGLGALAKDLPAAQNLSRPVFAVLLIVFFATLGQVIGMAGPIEAGFLYAPPFAPFMTLMAPPGSLSLGAYAVVFGGMALTTYAALLFAGAALSGQLPTLSWPAGRAPSVPA